MDKTITSTLIAIVLVSCAYNLVMVQTTPRCFQFTWLGPTFNESSIFMNATCQDATRLSNGIPCQEPLVVSKNGTRPDIHYIWQNHREAATCVLANTHVCAQYTYSFGGHVVNSTYMCTQAIDQMGNAITRGCFVERNGSFETRVCFCQSIDGAIPCNSAVVPAAVATSVIVTALAFMLK